MAERRCASCGAGVGILLDRCPACGADPDLQLLELGVGAGRGRRRPPATGGPRRRIGWRQWAPVAAAVVGVWGFLVITAGSDDDDDGGPTEQAADESSSTSRRKRDERPAPTRRGNRTTTTTTLVGGGGPVLGGPTGWQLVIGADTARVLDLDLGSVERISGGRVLAIGVDGVVMADHDSAAWLPAPFVDGTAVRLAAGQFDQAWIAPDGTVWLNGYEDDRGGYVSHLVRTTVDGDIERYEMTPTAWPLGASSAGLVLNGPSGVYVLSEDGDHRRIAEGEGIGTSGDLVAVLTCDETLDCSVVRVDARDGSRLDATDDADVIHQRWGPVSISPDGRVAHVVSGEDGSFHLAVDGVRVLDIEDPYVGALAWSPDGRWLATIVSGGTVRFVDTTGGQPTIEVAGRNDSWMLGFVAG